MKAGVGRLGWFAAVALLAAPLGSFAQNIASRPGLVDRGLERYTLLPGPRPANANPAPQGAIFVPLFSSTTRGEFRYTRTPPPNSGTLTLQPERRVEFAPATTKPLPRPESLRFDATLEQAPKLRLSK